MTNFSCFLPTPLILIITSGLITITINHHLHLPAHQWCTGVPVVFIVLHHYLLLPAAPSHSLAAVPPHSPTPTTLNLTIIITIIISCSISRSPARIRSMKQEHFLHFTAAALPHDACTDCCCSSTLQYLSSLPPYTQHHHHNHITIILIMISPPLHSMLILLLLLSISLER
jgi:hypothetical protein